MGMLKKGSLSRVGGHINHSTRLGHDRGGKPLALAAPRLMSLLSSYWECKYEQAFMPDRDIYL